MNAGPTSSLLASRAARVTLVMSCLFATVGVTLVFLPRWLEAERGLSGAQIGAVLALAQTARLITGPSIAFWADGVADRRTPLRVLSLAAIAAYAAFFFFANGFMALLAFGFVALTLMQPLTPLVEAATLRATTEGRFPYGVARGIGSIAFISANIAGGLLVARFGVGAVVVWVLAGLSLTFLAASFALQPDPHGLAKSRSAAARLGDVTRLLRSRQFVILIVACGLIQSAHAFYYSFSTLVWRSQGIPADTVGLLWAFGVVVEVAFLWSLPAIERRISPEALILLGAAGAVVRWTFLGFAPLGFALWPLQALHALSFAAAHVGAMRILFRDTPESSAAMAQTLYSVMSGGLLMGAATIVSGIIYDAAGAQGYWAMAVIATAGGSVALLLLGPRPRTPKASQH